MRDSQHSPACQARPPASELWSRALLEKSVRAPSAFASSCLRTRLIAHSAEIFAFGKSPHLSQISIADVHDPRCLKDSGEVLYHPWFQPCGCFASPLVTPAYLVDSATLGLARPEGEALRKSCPGLLLEASSVVESLFFFFFFFLLFSLSCYPLPWRRPCFVLLIALFVL